MRKLSKRCLILDPFTGSTKFWSLHLSDINFFLNFFLFAGFVHSCSYCKKFQTTNMDHILEHCKVCSSMPRPNPYKCKFVCHMCSYGTYHKALMQSHIFSHMGEKPFKCLVCDYSCTLKTNLSKHLQNAHGRCMKKWAFDFDVNIECRVVSHDQVKIDFLWYHYYSSYSHTYLYFMELFSSQVSYILVLIAKVFKRYIWIRYLNTVNFALQCPVLTLINANMCVIYVHMAPTRWF